MGLIRLLFLDVYGRRWWLLGCLVLQGAGITLVIAVVGDTYHETSFTLDFIQFGYFVLGSSLIILSVYQYRKLMITSSQELIKGIRDRYAEMLPKSDLQAIERGGSTHTYDVIARATSTLTEGTGQIVNGTQSAANFVAMALFILYLSPFAFAVLSVIVLTMYLHHRYVKPIRAAHFKTASEFEGKFFNILSHLVWGFKEIKMNARRGEDIEENFLYPSSAHVRDAKIQANNEILKGQMIGDGLFYVLWGTVVFVIPQYLDDRDRIFSLILCVTYMLQAVAGVVQSFPALSHADSAFSELDELQGQLQNDDLPAEQKAGAIDPTFSTIELSGLVFTHLQEDGQKGFTLGPCDLKVKRGDIVIFRGGNGSGKSTLLKALTFLYRPLSGSILWDGTPISQDNINDYRNLFATVFWDFHIFDRLYGQPDRTKEEVNGLLEEFNINHLTQYENGEFTRTDLSTGQRKRLALAVAILERRPILVLDEVAAEQDAEFRERFYRNIVPQLKAEGRTILISSHDDRYFDTADHIVILRDGRIAKEDT